MTRLAANALGFFCGACLGLLLALALDSSTKSETSRLTPGGVILLALIAGALGAGVGNLSCRQRR